MASTLLINRLNKEQALQKRAVENFKRKTVSFYRYVKIQDALSMRNTLFIEWNNLGVLGRTYIASEGINAQICVPEPQWDTFVEKLYKHPEFKDTPFKIAVEENDSFWKLTIKLKEKIVADGLAEDEYDVTNVGNHLNPLEFHEAVQDKDTVVVDMRNHYESRIGRFKNAICPDVDTFREELPMVKDLLKNKKDKKILLYCTGGIRCEKASAYLKHHGFNDVNQLYGGIINYAHEVKEKQLESEFIGKNFVFDDRIAEEITNDVLSQCDQCNVPDNNYTNCANKMCNLLFIQCEKCQSAMINTCSKDCKSIVQLSEEKQKVLRAGVKHTFSRFKKQVRPQSTMVNAS